LLYLFICEKEESDSIADDTNVSNLISDTTFQVELTRGLTFLESYLLLFAWEEKFAQKLIVACIQIEYHMFRYPSIDWGNLIIV